MRNIVEAKAADAPRLHDSFFAFGNTVELKDNVCQSRHVTRGDAAKALAESAFTVTQRFTTPFTEHAFLEPECAVAFPYKNGVKVQSTDQGAYDTRKSAPTCLAGTGPSGGRRDHARGRRLWRQGGRPSSIWPRSPPISSSVL
ncbi:MAG: molybdopterin cofactor-binding domain-containing protein [Collinsella sp.]